MIASLLARHAQSGGEKDHFMPKKKNIKKLIFS